jgi:hypothetical protein
MLTLERVSAVVAMWKQLLCLSNWEIIVCVCDDQAKMKAMNAFDGQLLKSSDGLVLAYIEPHPRCSVALMAVWSEVEDTYRHWGINQVVCHELVHLFFCRLHREWEEMVNKWVPVSYWNETNERMTEEEETAVEHISDAFVNAFIQTVQTVKSNYEEANDEQEKEETSEEQTDSSDNPISINLPR